jgi:hypothetical protein
MNGRPKTPEYSWVAASDSGSPTGYTQQQIHPDCLRQIRVGRQNVIRESGPLERWLENRNLAERLKAGYLVNAERDLEIAEDWTADD